VSHSQFSTAEASSDNASENDDDASFVTPESSLAELMSEDEGEGEDFELSTAGSALSLKIELIAFIRWYKQCELQRLFETLHTGCGFSSILFALNCYFHWVQGEC
jgi:hypothetical protein